MINAVLPVKDLVLAKSRLSGVLAPHERRSLNQAMLEDALAYCAWSMQAVIRRRTTGSPAS